MSVQAIEKHARVFAAPKLDAQGRESLIGLSRAELINYLGEHKIPAFRAKQIWHWIYQRGVQNFDEMGNIPKDIKAFLNDRFTVGRPEVETEQRSVDGTIKWLLKLADGQLIETVFIPEKDRGTLCISSQIGCTLSCKFCHTGTQPLVRNLGAYEILQQIMHARDVLEEWPSSTRKNEGRNVTNIVLMGMGEPLYNYDNVAKAMKICMDDDGLSISKRRITLSTSGLVPLIKQCGEELNVNLAISLHAVNDEIRDQIMPINKKYPLAELMQACREYPLDKRRRITFEYVMLKDVNDSDEDARNLAGLLDDIPSKVNIIPFNEWPGSAFECSDRKRIEAFAKILEGKGIDSPIRKTRGDDILAACGQLKSASTRNIKKK
ncbi:MAG: 23S rRNA (adenine(2503)-C(2))-methyltransferase RlmN [Pseudomonadota bacterium]